MTSPVVQAFAAVCLGLVVAAAALGLTFVFAPELRPVIDDPTPDEDEQPTADVVDEEPSEVDPPLRLHEELLYAPTEPAWRDARPGETPGQLEPQLDSEPTVILAEPSIETVGGGSPDGVDWSAARVGSTWVHRSCSNARRDSQPERVCAYCAPRLAGIPTAGGSK